VTVHRSITRLAPDFAICRLAPQRPVPSWAHGGALCSITITESELSIICETAHLPAESDDELEVSRGWRALRVDGPIPHTVVGVMAEISGALAAAHVSIMPIATYDTDYILVREDALARAVAALTSAGYRITER
jgi:hypothetical protein